MNIIFILLCQGTIVTSTAAPSTKKTTTVATTAMITRMTIKKHQELHCQPQPPPTPQQVLHQRHQPLLLQQQPYQQPLPV